MDDNLWKALSKAHEEGKISYEGYHKHFIDDEYILLGKTSNISFKVTDFVGTYIVMIEGKAHSVSFPNKFYRQLSKEFTKLKNALKPEVKEFHKKRKEELIRRNESLINRILE